MKKSFYSEERIIAPEEAKIWIENLGYKPEQINTLPTSDTVRIMYQISRENISVDFNAKMRDLIASRDGYNFDL